MPETIPASRVADIITVVTAVARTCPDCWGTPVANAPTTLDGSRLVFARTSSPPAASLTIDIAAQSLVAVIRDNDDLPISELQVATRLFPAVGGAWLTAIEHELAPF